MKEFQNKQHERLHNALIGAGFTDCGGENLPKLTTFWRNGYINQDLDEYLYFDNCDDNYIGARDISNGKVAACYGKPVADIITHYESLVETQPITKKNIEQFLKYNNLHHYLIDGFTLWLTLKREAGWDLRIDIRCDGLLEVIEGYFCRKLKPLPRNEVIELKVGDLVEFEEVAPQTIKGINYTDQEVYFDNNYFLDFKVLNNGRIKSVNGKSGVYKIPEFNFEQYLLDNGFKKEKSNHGILLKYSVFVTIFKSASITGNYWTCQGEYIQENPQNADILIAMAKLAKDLK